jgi:uncharacterized protein DUF5723
MRYFLYLLFFVASADTTYAQFNLGVATSEYNTINSMYLNPANIAGCKEKVVVNLFSISLSANNNLGSLNNLSNVFSNNAASTFVKSGAHTSFNMIAPSGEVRGPGLLISSYGDFKSCFGITSGIRVMNQFTNFDESVFNTVIDPGSAAARTIIDSSKNFNWTSHLWSEVGISYGIVLVNKNNNTLNFGFSLRYLGGLGYIGLKGNNLDVKYKVGNDTFQAINSDLEYASNVITTGNAVANGINSSNLYTGFFGTSGANGAGLDIGITFNHRFYNGETDWGDQYGYDSKAHNLKFSAAVNDIGSIKYKEGYNFIADVTGNGYLTNSGLSANSNNYADFKQYIQTKGFTVDTSIRATKVHLPTVLVLGADYNIEQHFYASAVFIGNLVNRRQFGNSYYSQFSIIPRYDTKVISMSIPFTYNSLANDYKMGLGFRISGFYFGSDDMLALISNKMHGFGFYVGASVPVYKRNS